MSEANQGVSMSKLYPGIILAFTLVLGGFGFMYFSSSWWVQLFGGCLSVAGFSYIFLIFKFKKLLST
jgi:hypothetical protein